MDNINGRLIAFSHKALRAHHAWAYCEEHGLGSFDQRQVLCGYAQYLTAKALAEFEGRSFDEKYAGHKKLIVWPVVRLDEATQDDAEALVREALVHEAESLAEQEPEQ